MTHQLYSILNGIVRRPQAEDFVVILPNSGLLDRNIDPSASEYIKPISPNHVKSLDSVFHQQQVKILLLIMGLPAIDNTGKIIITIE